MKTPRRMQDGTPIMDIQYTTDVATPHVPWANPLDGGPIKAFFLPSVKGGRDYVELMQRLDVDAVSVTHDRAWDLDKWGFGDFYHQRVNIWEYERIYGYMIDALTAPDHYDVIVLQSVNGWGYWPVEARKAILDRVKKGAGLVLVHPFEGEKPAPELRAVSPLVGCPNDTVDEGGYPEIDPKVLKSGPWKAKGSHFITKNVPLDALYDKETAYYPYKAAGKVILTAGDGDPLGAVGTYGKGRVVAFGWYNRDLVPQNPRHLKAIGGLSSNSDFWPGGFSECTWDYTEYVYSILARATLWAARRESGVGIKITAKDGSEPTASVTLSGKAGGVALTAVVKNEWGAEEARITKKPKETAAGKVELDLPAEALAAGVHLLNVRATRDGRAVEWGAARFDTPRRAAVASITLDKDVYAPSEKVTARVKVSGDDAPLRPVRMEAAIVDAFDRVVAQNFRNVTPGETVDVKLSSRGVMTPQMWVRVQLTEEGRLVDERKSERATSTPDYGRTIDDAELVVAQHSRGRGDYVEAVRKQLMKFGATSGWHGYNKILAQSGAKGGGIYWYHRAPYIERREKYIRTGDKKHLTRVPCLSDPAFQKEIHDTIVKTAVLGKKYAPLSYYVQDEGSITCYSDEQDLCHSEHTLKAMREWLKSVYGDVKKLNKEWGTDFTSWKKVAPMTIDEARAHGNLAPWADHRTFMEIVFADYFRLVRDSVREVDPDARIRLSGCQACTPHTGMDYWRLHQVVEYFEAYSGGNQFEFHQSFAGPRTILGTWIGYGQSGKTSNHRMWNSFFHQIRLYAVFWEPAVINPDFTLSGSAEDMAATWKDMHDSGISKMLFDAARNDCGIAVHYSYPSIHAAYGVGGMGRFNKARQGWLNILGDLGYQRTFLSRQQIEAGDLASRKFKLLIMPVSAAVSPEEAKAIRKFVKAGGAVIADYRAGVMDDHCRALAKGLLDDVFGIRRYNMRNEPFYLGNEPKRTAALPAIDAVAIDEAACQMEESGVRATKGEALFADDFTHYVPAFVVNRYGKGTAVYMNMGVDVCADDPDDARARALKSAVGEILDHIRIKPIMKVATAAGEPLDHVEFFGYKTPGVQYFCMLRDNVGTKARVAYDGIVHGGEETESEAESIRVELPVEGHVYDSLSGKYLGATSAFDATIEPAEAKVYAVLPYEVESLDVSVRPAGNVVKYDFQIGVSRGKARRHAVALEVTDPSGERSVVYSKNLLARGGKAKGEIRFSLEGESGVWKLKFTEAASGISRSVEVMVP